MALPGVSAHLANNFPLDFVATDRLYPSLRKQEEGIVSSSFSSQLGTGRACAVPCRAIC